MKSIKLFALLASVAFLFACSKKDDLNDGGIIVTPTKTASVSK